jgi:streptogramin lyase
MTWNDTTPASQRRHVTNKPQYVPGSARSVAVVVDGGYTATTPGGSTQYLNSPGTSLTFNAPTGNDTFNITVYDEQNGLGNVLGEAGITQAVTGGSANVLSAVINGVIASLSLSLAQPNAGTATAVTLNVAALDADGNIITGPGDYNTPIALSINDPTNSGTLSLSQKVLQNPNFGTVTLNYSGETLTTADVLASATGAAAVQAIVAPTPTVYTYAVTSGIPQWIAAYTGTPYMFFTENPGNSIVRIGPGGTMTPHQLSAPAAPAGIVAGDPVNGNGTMWFAGYSSNQIIEYSVGAFTDYPTQFGGSDEPFQLVDRGDGTIWFTAYGGNHLGFVQGDVSGEIAIPTVASQPYGITEGPDNNLYFTESNADKIGRLANEFSPFQELQLPTGTGLRQIVAGPDGNIWFTEVYLSEIGVLSTSCFCVIANYPTLSPNAAPLGITVGTDGALWFTENGLNRIGRSDIYGKMSEYVVAAPNAYVGLQGIAASSDGSIWFTEANGPNAAVGRLVY